MRWSLKLSELDFIVEHKPGSKISHVDALSRHVSAVKYENSLDKEIILQEKQKDELYTKQNPRNYTRKRESFIDCDGVMYRLQRHDGIRS